MALFHYEKQAHDSLRFLTFIGIGKTLTVCDSVTTSSSCIELAVENANYCINSIYNALWRGAETWQKEGLNGRNRVITRRFKCRSSPCTLNSCRLPPGVLIRRIMLYCDIEWCTLNSRRFRPGVLIKLSLNSIVPEPTIINRASPDRKPTGEITLPTGFSVKKVASGG
ncbi:hypothetical protein DPMN_015086 [Dreissena polymorpha]|uniref:Uncharacterized protein n=1 Tax=Dreissena polymorpha TaxID=45954 RepID=A0A9D4NAV1_DREPO|nr:hypothetical protein DPMN_015086 [Dreissena polymorpha]